MAFFTKEEIIERMKKKHAEAGSKINDPRADFNLALLILGSSLFEKRLKSGNDYGEHPVHVGMNNTRSNSKRIIGILHDVVEDSNWTLDDLRAVGFSERIVSAVDGMTHRDGELYFDSIQRCSENEDSVDKKLEDLSHNMDQSRNSNFLREKDVERIHKYMIAREYLLSVKRNKIKAGSSIIEFVKLSAVFNKAATKNSPLQTAQEVALKYSSVRKSSL